MENKNSHSKGYTVLFAVLISSLILSVGLGIINITLKEITLSASGRESQLAFYVADSIAECAQYWEPRGIFDIPDPSYDRSVPKIIECFSDSIEVTYDEDPISLTGTDLFATSRFDVRSLSYCGEVEVKKYTESGAEKTTITASGRNTCVESSARQVERSLIINF